MDNRNDNSAESGLNVLEKSFQEYKNKLQRAEQEAQEIVNLAWQKAEKVIEDKQKEAQITADNIRKKAEQEAKRLLTESQEKAAKIARDAEIINKKTAREKTKQEVEKIIADTRRQAEDDAAEILAHAKFEAESIVDEARRNAERQTLEEAENIIDEAKEKAQQVDKESMANAEEINKLVLDVLQKSKDAINRFRTQLQSELTELASAVGKARDEIEMRVLLEQNIEEPASQDEVVSNKPSFKEWRELNVLMPYDRPQIRRIEELLKQIPGIKLDGESATEESFSFYLNITEPVPLQKMLRELSIIDSYEDRGEMIKLRLKQGKNGN